MEALISGTNGYAALIENGVAQIVNMAGDTRELSIERAHAVCARSSDTIRLADCTREQAMTLLRNQWRKDRALLLTLLLLDQTTPEEERREISETLDSWFEESETLDFVLSVLYSKPLPIDEVNTPRLGPALSKLEAMVNAIFESQPLINAARSSWDKASVGLNETQRQAAEAKLVSRGVFFKLSLFPLDEIKFQCLEILSEFPNYRNLVADFLAPLEGLQKDLKATRPLVNQSPPRLKPVAARDVLPSTKTGYDKFKNAQRVLNLVESLMNVGDYSAASSELFDLVDGQLAGGEPQYACKSLCNASAMAKNSGNFSLQLELATRAYEVYPNDQQSVCEIADAYLSLGEPETAYSWFEKAPEDEYSVVGKMRALQRIGRLEEAISYCENLPEQYEHNLDYLLVYASVLRENRLLDAAIAKYSKAKELFPSSHVAACGLAATYADAKLYEKSLKAYDQAIAFFPSVGVPFTGKGHLLARLGDIRSALVLLQKGIELAEDKLIAVNALASALMMSGDYARAAKFLDTTYSDIANDIGSESLWEFRIDAATNLGKYKDAQKLLDEARGLFDEGKFKLQEARIYKLIGDHTRAIELLEEAVMEPEHYLQSKLELSKIYRVRNELSKARDIVSRLVDHQPDSAAVEREAVLLGISAPPENHLESRITIQRLASLEDWEFDQACTTAYISRESTRDAWRLSLDGKKRSPYRHLKKTFGLLLAIAKDLLGQSGSVPNALAGNAEPESEIVKAISYWRLGLPRQLDQAKAGIRRSMEYFNERGIDAARLLKLLEGSEEGQASIDSVEKSLAVRFA